MFRKLIATCLFTLAGVCALAGLSGGCDASGRFTLDSLRSDLRATTQSAAKAVSDAEAEIAKLPPGSPDRLTLESKLEALKRTLSAGNEKLQQADKVLAGLQQGDTTALITATQGIPYAGMAIFLGGLLWKWRNEQTAKSDLATMQGALEQVVHSVEQALPDKPDAVKSVMNEVQDSRTRAIVEMIKSSQSR